MLRSLLLQVKSKLDKFIKYLFFKFRHLGLTVLTVLHNNQKYILKNHLTDLKI